MLIVPEDEILDAENCFFGLGMVLAGDVALGDAVAAAILQACQMLAVGRMGLGALTGAAASWLLDFKSPRLLNLPFLEKKAANPI